MQKKSKKKIVEKVEEKRRMYRSFSTKEDHLSCEVLEIYS